MSRPAVAAPAPRGWLELVGVAGSGKTTAAEALSCAVAVRRADPSPGVVALLAWWFGPMPFRSRWATVRLTALVLTRVRGPVAARSRRVWLLLRGLARLRLTRSAHAIVFDEGPFTWTQSLRWRGEADFLAAHDALVALYRAAGARLVFFRLDPEERAKRWQRREGPRAWSPGIAAGLKVPPEERGKAFAQSLSRCLAQPGFAMVLDVDACTPQAIAYVLAAHLATP